MVAVLKGLKKDSSDKFVLLAYMIKHNIIERRGDAGIGDRSNIMKKIKCSISVLLCSIYMFLHLSKQSYPLTTKLDVVS